MKQASSKPIIAADLRKPAPLPAAIGIAILLALTSSCGRTLQDTSTTTTTTTTTVTTDESLTAVGAKVSFHFLDSYSLVSPHPSSGCAGDIKRFYHPLLLNDSGTPLEFPESDLDSTVSAHPNFIKNFSVDITDANTDHSLNQALSCSLGTTPLAPPSSRCATFDYSALGGVSTGLNSSLILLGGLKVDNGNNTNVTCGLNEDGSSNLCESGMYALGVKTLPASTATDPVNALVPGLTSASEAISSWVSLSGESTYTGPRGATGASLGLSRAAKKLVLFGGYAPVSTDSNATAHPSNETWLYDFNTQTWSSIATETSVANEIKTETEGTRTWQKAPGARSHFGYATAQGYNLALPASTTTYDPTDRILIAVADNTTTKEGSLRKFTPTYEPEWIYNSGVANNALEREIDSYHSQIMTDSSHFFRKDASTPPPVNFGLVNLVDTSTPGSVGQGYPVAAGGYLTGITPPGTYLSNDVLRQDLSTWTWAPLGTALSEAPTYAGVSVLPGFDLLNNHFVLFGGSSCNTYLTTNSGCDTDSLKARYWNMTQTPTGNLPATTAFGGTAPAAAGMASARGVDPAGNVLIVAYGGVKSTDAVNTSIHYLYDNAGAPTWVEVDASSQQGTKPTTPPIDGAMVYSHVSNKFYLFGGYRRTTATSNSELWELTVSLVAPNAACTTSGTCTFTWRRIDTLGMTCNPSCPTARRGHRMLEANYYNRNPGGTLGSADGESTCTAGAPCSYGIFMEGGTLDGATTLSDRWMFDPTANDGKGHWQQMGDLPPRSLAAMTTLDYEVPGRNMTAKRALLFGGETGLQNPGTTFVSPTLGDIWMFDFSNNTWNKVRLLGKGLKNKNLPTAADYTNAGFDTEFKARETYNANDTIMNELSPPPLAGTVMVTRTHIEDSTNPGTMKLLKIPEVFLFGGRKKDGTILPLDSIYKFCAGTTGEKPYGEKFLGQAAVAGDDDATCDAYDETDNPDMLAPTDEYVGRWLRKTPIDDLTDANDLSMAAKSSYLGAATYDSSHDLIILFGGLNGSAITNSPAPLGSMVYEYKPPSKTAATATKTLETQGTWYERAACNDSSPPWPDARYGHTLNFDSTGNQLVVVGGYDAFHRQLTQSITDSNGNTVSIPEVWTAKRRDTGTNAPCYEWSQVTVFGNSLADTTKLPPSTGLSHASAVFIPGDGYSTGYYTLQDDQCEKAGPIASGDSSINKLMAGGAYFDIDRTALAPTENLLLNLTYIPLGIDNSKPDGSSYTLAESALLKVHLVSTALATGDLRLVFQPRHIPFSDFERYPMTVQTLSVLAPPTGQMREDQLLIPLAIDPSIDRIRIERYSGSAILIDATLLRMGDPSAVSQ